MTLKFRNRIALFNTLAVAIITLMVFSVIYIVVYETAYYHLDEDILFEKEEVFNNLDWDQTTIIINKMPEWDEAEHNKIEVNPTFLQIVDTQGKIVFHSANLLTDRFPFSPHHTDDFFFDGEISGQKIRLGQFQLKNDSGDFIGQLTIAVSQQESFAILNNLIWVLVLSFPLVLSIQFIASSFAASKAIEPVNKLINTASLIDSANIGTRLDLPEHKDELYDLARTINALLNRIEVSMMQQKQFTSDASHEIRTPLAAIRGTLEVLLRKKREPVVYEEKMAGIISQVDRLDDLLEKLLQLARIESDSFLINKDEVQLSVIVAAWHTKWLQMAETMKISISIDIPGETVVNCDKLYLELILDNLVNNAIKYGKENGNVTLKWDDRLNTLSIIDNGIGITPENLPHIFDRFYRADESRSSVVKGNGLGLSIVKKLADAQHIKLIATSEAGKGSTFSLQFPV
ncbi:MAG: HAMP domain-containing histidine kinase [Bacteroidales bacterium]|nr:HAMP domain-containing histidine kinase [Bacteroidales bacterium]